MPPVKNAMRSRGPITVLGSKVPPGQSLAPRSVRTTTLVTDRTGSDGRGILIGANETAREACPSHRRSLLDRVVC